MADHVIHISEAEAAGSRPHLCGRAAWVWTEATIPPCVSRDYMRDGAKGKLSQNHAAWEEEDLAGRNSNRRSRMQSRS